MALMVMPRLCRFRVSFIGSDFASGVKCGKYSLPQVSFDELASGTKHAVDVDAISERASATDYGALDDSTDRAQKNRSELDRIHAEKFLNYQAQMWPYADGVKPSEVRIATGDNGQYLYVEECALPRTAGWRAVQGKSFDSSPKLTLLPFQVNWTSIGDATDYESAMDSKIHVDRGSGRTLVEQYPSMDGFDSAWAYDNRVDWQNKLGEKGNLGCTDQPVYLFSNRGASDKLSIYMLWSGVLLGVIGALLIEMLSWTAELFHSSHEEKGSTSP
ncbi:hypothetical protein K7711_27870 [Nocardia sp. CA2R105]|uniref:hypothetical protein n=1 Tax=Nocardia coffeae TaxID=2873381 RepID=UPI001CA7210C|nr:hypothetical protein [Nocardia coffeae]MBY8860320.1 hypothetical protein [Nocardia coffeae]